MVALSQSEFSLFLTPFALENIEWKVPEVNKFIRTFCTIFSGVKSYANLFHLTWDTNHPFVQSVHMVNIICQYHLVAFGFWIHFCGFTELMCSRIQDYLGTTVFIKT